EDDLAQARGVDELLHLEPGALVSLRGPLAQHVDAAMHVGVVVLVVVPQLVQDGARLLRGGGVIEIDEPFSVDRLAEDRKLLAQPFDLQAARCALLARQHGRAKLNAHGTSSPSCSIARCWAARKWSSS